MNISFSGIKNGGAQMSSKKEIVSIKKGAYTIISPKCQHLNFHVELNNDGNEDLEEFKYILKAFPNRFNKKTLNLDYDEYVNPDTKKTERTYVINDTILEVNDKTFPVFNRIFKFLKRIENMPADEMKVENYYLDSPEALDSFYYYKNFYTIKDKNENVTDFDLKGFLEMIEKSHTPEKTKLGAKHFSKKIEAALKEYIYSK